VRNSGAISVALDEAKLYIARAQASLAGMPANAYRRALSDLAEYFVSRKV
jgi:geranylgeranyl pyrophosphate synthase